MKFGVVFFLCLCIFCIQVSKEKFLKFSSFCLPPKGDVCIAIRKCPYFNELLDNSPIPRPRNVIKIIRDHQCGFNGNIPYVCCNKPTTTTPETTTEERTDPTPLLEDDHTSMSLTEHPNYYLLPRNICGNIKTDSRITNGQKAEINEFPWMALIFYNSSDGIVDFRCGGTLITERYVLTAAHCIINQIIVGVRLGDYNVETKEDCEPNTDFCAPPTQDFQVDKILIHPDYNPRTYSNDIALVKLYGAANFNYANIQPICLPVETELKSRSAIVTGWGVTEDGYKSQVLLQVRMPILALSECYKIYNKFLPITKNQICAGGYKGRDSCGGDSGGPLKEVGEVNGIMRYIQYGIVSFGPRYCGTNGKPGIYTKVKSYMKWILDNLEE